MKVTVEELKKLDVICEHIEVAFDKDGKFHFNTTVNSLVLSQDLLWLSTLLFNLLEDVLNNHERNIKRVSRFLDRINTRLNKNKFK